MDRPVSKEHKRKILIRQLSVVSLIIIVPLVAVLFLRLVFIPAVSLSKVITAVVERGDIYITVQGSGVVVPAYEELITSPFRSNILRIVKNPGAKVHKSDTLVFLDNKLAENDLGLVRNELDLQKIRIEKLRIELQQLKDDYGFSSKIKEIKVENSRLEFESEVALNKLGGSPVSSVKKAKTEWDIQQLELSQAQFNYNNLVNAKINGIQDLQTQIRIQENKIMKAQDMVNRAYVKAPFDGDLSWIVNQPGATVTEGQELARVADFSHFKIKGSISNAFAGKIVTGQRVEIRNQGRNLEGVIENIMPSVSQGMMESLIRIDKGDISLLRPSQQLEIRVVTSFRQNILRLPNANYYKDRGYKDMYLIRGSKASRVKALFGEANFDWVEVVDGIKEGDRVIISDISEKYLRKEIKVGK